MPISMYKDYMYSYEPSYTPSYRSVTLPVAFQMVVDGKVGATDVFNQSPKEVQKIIDEACGASFGRDFKHLTHDERKEVFTVFLLILGNVENNVKSGITNRGSNAAPLTKRWWQFWR